MPQSSPASIYVEALVDCPGAQQVFTYKIPAETTVNPGDILAVPFGAQQVGAIALRLTADCPLDIPAHKIRAIEDVTSASLFPPGYWPLLEKVSDYYHTSLMATIRVILPPGLLRRSQRRVRLTTPILENAPPSQVLSPTAQQVLHLLQSGKSSDYTWTYLKQKVKGAAKGIQELQKRGWVETFLQTKAAAKPQRKKVVTLLNPDLEALTPRQAEIVLFLKKRGGELWLKDLLGYTHTSASTVKTLEKKGVVHLSDRETLRLESSQYHRDQPKVLTPEQTSVLDIIHSTQGFSTQLLHGVTGSGKTEVYLQAIAPILAAGQSALVLVPEIGLTPQMSDRVRARFGDRVRVYHSALSEGERYDTWRVLLDAEPQILIGTRSAIFAPLPNLGLIILDEEHDSGYKQESPAPCYHARTVARWRAEIEDCPLILGTATPSLETWSLVQENWVQENLVQKNWVQENLVQKNICLSLPNRVNAQPLPPITLVDMRQELQKGNRSVFSHLLQQRLEEMQVKKQQGILFINRRGHSTFVSCRSCGYVVECPHCSVSLTYHHTHQQTTPLLRCHYCNYTATQPKQCPECESPYFRYFGSGTQRVMEELREHLPNLSVLRFDSDTTRRKGAHRELLTQFAQGEVDLMVGTQMLTKGIDIPQVQFVGVLAADSLLNLSDFRASERTFQTLLQVAGRTGRGTQGGQVFIQTYNPEHPVLQAVQSYQWSEFTAGELADRKALRYPPFGQLILLKISGPREQQVTLTAEAIATQLREILGATFSDFSILGPAPAQVLRIARRYRWQILIKLPRNADCQTLDIPIPVDYLRSLCPKDVRFGIDVDPLHFS